MARKNYSEQFRRDAAALYETTPGATVRSIAADLGVERGTLRHWLDQYGTGRKTAGDGSATTSPLTPRPHTAAGRAEPVVGDETPEQELARLRTRVRQLETETAKLATEREILQKAAKYFAGETNW